MQLFRGTRLSDDEEAMSALLAATLADFEADGSEKGSGGEEEEELSQEPQAAAASPSTGPAEAGTEGGQAGEGADGPLPKQAAAGRPEGKEKAAGGSTPSERQYRELQHEMRAVLRTRFLKELLNGWWEVSERGGTGRSQLF